MTIHLRQDQVKACRSYLDNIKWLRAGIGAVTSHKRPSRLGGAKLSLDGFPSGGCPQCQAAHLVCLPGARTAMHVLSGGSARQMRNRINSIKADHALNCNDQDVRGQGPDQRVGI